MWPGQSFAQLDFMFVILVQLVYYGWIHAQQHVNLRDDSQQLTACGIQQAMKQLMYW